MQNWTSLSNVSFGRRCNAVTTEKGAALCNNLHPPSCEHVTVHTYISSSSTDAQSVCSFFGEIATSKFTFTVRAARPDLLFPSGRRLKERTHFLFAAISKNLFGRINATRSLTTEPAPVEVSFETKN